MTSYLPELPSICESMEINVFRTLIYGLCDIGTMGECEKDRYQNMYNNYFFINEYINRWWWIDVDHWFAWGRQWLAYSGRMPTNHTSRWRQGRDVSRDVGMTAVTSGGERVTLRPTMVQWSWERQAASQNRSRVEEATLAVPRLSPGRATRTDRATVHVMLSTRREPVRVLSGPRTGEW